METVKRLSMWAQQRQLRSARRSLKARKRFNARRRQKNLGIFAAPSGSEDKPVVPVTFYKRGKVLRGFARARTPMPEHFCLIENHEAVAAFLGELRHNLTIAGTKLQKLRLVGGSRRRGPLIADDYVDFTTLKHITPASALVLASEFDRAITLLDAPDWIHAIDIDRWEPAVLRTLDDVGFLSLLNVEKQKTSVALHNGVYTVPFISGAKVNTERVDRLIRAMAAMADGSGGADSETLLNRSRVYDGLGEAIQNVEDHA
jgi:hypothetical protein